MARADPPRVAYVVTHPITARNFLRGHLPQMREWGFDVTLITAAGPDLDAVRARDGVRCIELPLRREIRPAADARALAGLVRVLKDLRPHIINASTPKAALLGLLAATTVGVPIRYYLLRGLRGETARGAFRLLLDQMERLTAAHADRIIAVSHSLRDAYLARQFTTPDRIAVLADGSSNGVDAARFAATDARRRAANQIRETFGIPAAAPVIGFVGRFARDKGIADVLAAFDRVRAHVPTAWLLLVGDEIAGERTDDEIRARIRRTSQIAVAGFTADTAPFYAAMDVLAFPSLREGFPNVPLEAAAAGVPTVGTRATGTVDAIVDGETGALIAPGDGPTFAAALIEYLTQPARRTVHGHAAQMRVRKNFAPPRMWAAWAAEYRAALAAIGLPLPSAFESSRSAG